MQFMHNTPGRIRAGKPPRLLSGRAWKLAHALRAENVRRAELRRNLAALILKHGRTATAFLILGALIAAEMKKDPETPAAFTR